MHIIKKATFYKINDVSYFKAQTKPIDVTVNKFLRYFQLLILGKLLLNDYVSRKL